MAEPKKHLLIKFLGFVNQYIPLTVARMATLGGQGLEAKLWEQFNVPKQNGWLIERQGELRRNLIANSQYRYHNKLETLTRAIEANFGTNAGLDSLHLDLCGTLEASLHLIHPLLQLIWNGTGRCLAVTVTEQRRNGTIEHWVDVNTWLEENLGSELNLKLEQAISSEQNKAPRSITKNLDAAIERSIKRELGVFRLLAEGLWNAGLIPDEVVRYGYVSATNFRMRTYVMHLQNLSQMSEADFFSSMVKSWNENPIQWLTMTGIEKTMSIRNAIPNLLKLQPMLAPEAATELDALIKAAESAKAPELQAQLAEKNGLLDSIRQLLDGKSVKADAIPTTLTEVVSSEPKTKRAYNKRATGKKSSKKTAGKKATSPVELPDAISTSKLMELNVPEVEAEMIGLIEVEAKVPNAVLIAREATATRLGYDFSKKSDRRTFGGKVSRTRGKFFPAYLKKATMNADSAQKEQITDTIAGFGATALKRPTSKAEILSMMN